MRICLFLFIVTLQSCLENKDKNLRDVILDLENKKKNIIIIINKRKSNEHQDKIDFRRNLIKITNKINQFEPNQIIFDYFFREELEGNKSFVKHINENSRSVSFFNVNDTKRIENNDQLMFKKYSTKLNENQRIFSSDEFYEYSGAIFPNKEVIKTSKSICVGNIESNFNDELVGILIYIQLNDHLFSSCPISIVNNVIEKYKLKIGFDFEKSTPSIIETNFNKTINILPYEMENSKKYININFFKFNHIESKEFLEKEIKINKDSIFIISDNTRLFKVKNGEFLSYTDILVSEIITLINLLEYQLTRKIE